MDALKKEKDKHLGLRIDSELHYKLHYISQYEGRSANGEVIYLIRNGTKARVERIPELLKKFKGMRLVTAKQSGFAIRHSKLIQEELLDHVAEEVQTIYTMIIRPEDAPER